MAAATAQLMANSTDFSAAAAGDDEKASIIAGLLAWHTHPRTCTHTHRENRERERLQSE